MASKSKFSGDTRWTLMFRELKKEVSTPTEKHLTARVWRQSDLKSVITNIRNREIGELKSTFPPAKDVISRMLEIGWVREISLELNSEEKTPTLYLLDMEATEEELPDSWELLQGFKPAGVICYLGAASFYELTTQVPTFYHIANLRPSSPSYDPDEVLAKTATNEADQKRDPLGTLEFRFQGVDYYTTSRDESSIPGLQMRVYGSRTQLRITTLEQTMLDTLWQPLKFGGESIILEVWDRGVQQWNPERMAKHLATINRQDWTRRVGAMLSLIGMEADGSLRSLLTESSKKQQLENDLPLSLMPGLPATNLIEQWGILIP